MLGTALPMNAVATTSCPNNQPGAACSAYVANAVAAATTVKSSTGNLYGLALQNNIAAVVWVEFFNTTTLTLGTTTPVAAFPIAASGQLVMPPSAIALLNFSSAIAMAAVSSYNGSTTGSVTGTVFYK
jgi:hypothetical protein